MVKTNSSKHLTQDDFLNLIDNAKLVSIDIVLRTADGAILKGKRINSPAKGKWFVPGGRICKGETIRTALARILQDELKIDSFALQGIFSGPYDHLYPGENSMDIPGIDTEYVVFGYYANVNRDYITLKNLPLEQHSRWAWIKEHDPEIFDTHENSRQYFELSKYVLFDPQAYETLNRRRDSFNQLLWSTPSVSLVAQSFLFSIILGSGVSNRSRFVASVLSIVVSVASLQLLSKHRYNEKELAVSLERIETCSNRYPLNSMLQPNSWFIRQSSYQLWLFMIGLFGVAALAVIVLLVFNPDFLAS
ncbi:NUDIX domain-containing protein [Nodosilinea sp. PGN35]|uniref:NUDIX domain-containing protein n=1 Tax=Nodosilinea sp. PGN35 TaxID=3020489 RepID=UPI0023B24221|nr:NUDIX domain-containing protein [Nodosilinea sp. TSF1-S3]MDF0365804.1 NUDIX domain-containing protein [Nodosilinea sp. TSF1-S3]